MIVTSSTTWLETEFQHFDSLDTAQYSVNECMNGESEIPNLIQASNLDQRRRGGSEPWSSGKEAERVKRGAGKPRRTLAIFCLFWRL